MKARRQAIIRRIIQEQPIDTQEALARALRAEGFQVTQATISRDIAEMGLVKLATAEGGYRWVLPPSPGLGSREALERARRAFREYVIGVDASLNVMVIRTLPGAAHAVAAAIDALQWPEALATLAGDDTILVVVAEPESGTGDPLLPVDSPLARAVEELRQRFRALMAAAEAE